MVFLAMRRGGVPSTEKGIKIEFLVKGRGGVPCNGKGWSSLYKEGLKLCS